jgi:hypothetical protein
VQGGLIIDNNQQRKAGYNSEFYSEEISSKMPVFSCSCGVKILIVPDLYEMKKAIENHIVEHKKLSGLTLTENDLAQQILKVIIEKQS